MTNEELTLWCNAQGMSYPGTLAGLLMELVKQRSLHKEQAVDERNRARLVYAELANRLDQLGVSKGDENERPFNALERLDGLRDLIEGLKEEHPKVAETCGENDRRFLAALVENYGDPRRLEDVMDKMNDGQIARIAGLASAEILARRMRLQIGGGIFGKE